MCAVLSYALFEVSVMKHFLALSIFFQVLVRWSLQKGFIPLPKSVRSERQAVNLDVFGFELDQQDMDTLDKLECHGVTAWDPISRDPV